MTFIRVIHHRHFCNRITESPLELVRAGFLFAFVSIDGNDLIFLVHIACSLELWMCHYIDVKELAHPNRFIGELAQCFENVAARL